jgi:hypothetical protein
MMKNEDAVDADENQERLNQRLLRISVRLQQYALSPLPGQSGVIIGIGGHPVSLEIITSTHAFKNHLETLLNSIAPDAAMAEQIPTPNHRARRFAEIIMDTPMNMIDAGISGQLFEGEDDVVNIKALQPASSGGAAIHTTVINKIHELILA